MVNFLIHRPIAVSMTYLAFIILGIAALTQLPVSLMPDADIPKITVQVTYQNTPARELENGVVKRLRTQLKQVPHIKDITSTTRDEHASIELQFEYGANIDYAFIQVNEKIDRSMNYLPRDMNRPKVIKASASDIPVFYLNITASSPAQTKSSTSSQTKISNKFMELSRFSRQILKKQMEQLPDVAMADISGLVKPEIAIIPNMQKLQSYGIHPNKIEERIKANNYNIGNMVIRDGHYQYNIRVRSLLKDKKSIRNITFNIGGEIIYLSDIAHIKARPQKRSGLVTSQKQNAITMAIIKRTGAQMRDLESSLHNLISRFRNQYPDMHFEIMRDKTELLNYSIRNIKQTLLLGAALAFLMMFFFLRDIRSPFLIGLSIPTALIISILFFYIFNISINIISLSGLILGIGLMIDNSIIVIDNITQFLERGESLTQACVKGTNEIIRPLLSSVLTTCAVFIPLIFISGIAGSLFYDQAVAIAIGLFASFFVSITLLPVYYKLVYRRRKQKSDGNLLNKRNNFNYFSLYERGLRLTLKYQWAAICIFGSILGIGIWLFMSLDKQKLPDITQDEVIVGIDWNENIHIQTNKCRCFTLISKINEEIEQSSTFAGLQQFMMRSAKLTAPQEARIYLRAHKPDDIKKIKETISSYMSHTYPQARLSFHPPANIFEQMFAGEQAPLVAKIMPFEKQQGLHLRDMQHVIHAIDTLFEEFNPEPPPSKEHLDILIDPEKLLLYDIPRRKIVHKLQSLFNAYRITELKNSQNFTPVMLGEENKTIYKKLNNAYITNREGSRIPIMQLITLKKGESLKHITAGHEGEYYPVSFHTSANRADSIKNVINTSIKQNNTYDIAWTGSIYANKRLIGEILIILGISLLLLYFILASQFESLTLPFIVLLEVPIDIGGACLLLYLFGQSINVMSLIGMIVMAGIIINDSILKIDTIGRLHRSGMPIMKALIIGGKRRLKPILMTSLTTIMAMIPFLFISGLGSDLQKPLAISIIGGMLIGTLVSLYFIPLFYYYLRRKV